MKWIMNNYAELSASIASLAALVWGGFKIVARITKTKKDDEIVQEVEKAVEEIKK